MPNTNIPTVAEIDAQWAACLEKVGRLHLHREFVIEDYPLGYGMHSRGQCRLQVQYRPGRGFRTVRDTREPGKDWAPTKKRTKYTPHPIVVVSGPDLGRRAAAWLCMDMVHGPHILCANYDVELELLDCAPPLTRRPVREHKRDWIAYDGVHREVIFEADPPEMCEAWDRWWLHYRSLASTLMAFALQGLLDCE